jgi:malate synthase
MPLPGYARRDKLSPHRGKDGSVAYELTAAIPRDAQPVITNEALAFVALLHERFDATRRNLLDERVRRQATLDSGTLPDFLSDTAAVRAGTWTVAPPPPDLADRRCEITGPCDRKMMINALNSGARVFMADLEDSMSPTWENVTVGQRNLYDAIRRDLELTDNRGKQYALGDTVATLMVRPRGWHLTERHMLVNGAPVSASLFDFGMTFFNNAKQLIANGSGPYFYLPKLENHREARLWNDVFVFAQEHLGIPRGSIKTTVLIETILASFEMDEILYELREHSVGLNAGRWDYIFSAIKKFRNHGDVVFPDRGDIAMTVPFMHAYTELLIATCHKRGAHAMGGMSAFIPSRRDEEINTKAFAKVREDKEREARAGHDGTWVAHPDLVGIATEIFDDVLGSTPNQIDRQRSDVHVTQDDLITFTIPGGEITERGLRMNVDVAVRYLASWLSGNGAAAIYNLMEDAATAEISRSQLWQWAAHGASLVDGRVITKDLIRSIADEELENIRAEFGDDTFSRGRFGEAAQLLETVALADSFPEFLTLPAYQLLDTEYVH